MKSNINILVLSDIHLGHDKNKTLDIVTNLRKFFKTYRNKIIKADMIIISGDTFDRLLASNSLDLMLANEWLTELIKYCRDYNIKLRILEGTPSHDWKQVKNLYNIINSLNIEIDFKYIEILDIEYIEEYNLNILYLPDEWKHTSEDIYKAVLNKLKDYNLDKVDMAIMHGAFSFQLPDFLDNLLEPEDYLKIVKGPIIIGHVHNYSKYKRIVVPGSFDALTHADDNKKGGIFLNLDLNTKEFTFEFLENKYKLRFKTIDVTNKDVKEVIKILNKINDDKLQYIRLLINKNSTIQDSLNELKSMYPNIKLSTKDIDKKVVNKSIDETLVLKTTDNIILDKDTILNYIEEKASHEDIDIYNGIKNVISKLVSN